MRARFVGALKWLVPGIGVKRWLLLSAIGLVLFLNGVSRWFVAEGNGLQINELLDNLVNDFFPPSYLTYIFGISGLVLLVLGMRLWLRSLVRAARSQNGLLDGLLGRRLEQGYHIVAIGGGTGLSTLLRGLKRRTTNLTAVVTVSDDGGSSGRLQKELGVLPPGDVRNCLVALADDEALVTDLFRYRFEEGEGLSGHSFGNLFLAAMTGITGNFDAAVKESSRVLNIVGRVLPSTLAVVRLCAELLDGSIVEGESRIPLAGKPVRRVFFDPATAAPLQEAIDAIRSADAIVLGPGSLFTSILPNFLVERIADEVARSSAVKIYVCNVMTQPGETDNLSASQHVDALFENAGARVCDYVLINDQPPARLLKRYAAEGQIPVVPDVERVLELGVTPVRAQAISEEQVVRHDPHKLADAVIRIIDRAVAGRTTFVRPATAYNRSGESLDFTDQNQALR